MRTKLALALLLLVPAAAFAGKKEDLQKRAQQAASARRLDEAADALCELAKLDSSKASDCQIARNEAAAEEKRNDARFSEGVAFFNRGALDDAEQKLKNIRFGARYSEAQRYMTQLIPAKRREQQAAQADSVNIDRWNEAASAYNGNDFARAKRVLATVAGSKAADAQALLAKINQYESAMAEGDRLTASGNHRQAQQSYEDAARLKQDGPGDPRGKAAREQAAAAAPAGTSRPTTTTATIATPTPTPTTQAAARPPAPSAAPISRAGAIKEPARPKLDTARLLKEAQDARSAGNNAAAKGKYIAVLAEDPNNSAARTALAQIQQEEEAKPAPAQQQVAATPEADIMLARGIGEYYKGAYVEAEGHIKDYQNVNGSKKALGFFYLGVSKLTRYYLGGASDRKLYNDATTNFRMAKDVPGFSPPGEQYISPKLLKIYNSL